MSELVPCQACSRHIRSTEPACPFCGIPRTPVSLTAPIYERPTSRGMVMFASTAAILAAATTTSGCGKEDKRANEPDTASTVQAFPPYGVPAFDEDAAIPPPPPPPPPPHDAGRLIQAPPYGIPPIDDRPRPKKK